MITIDLGDIANMISADEIQADIIENLQDTANAIFNDLTSPAPIGTPVDLGGARNGWDIDLTDPLAPEVFNRVVYIGRLNAGHSQKSPAGFVDAIVDKHIR